MSVTWLPLVIHVRKWSCDLTPKLYAYERALAETEKLELLLIDAAGVTEVQPIVDPTEAPD